MTFKEHNFKDVQCELGVAKIPGRATLYFETCRELAVKGGAYLCHGLCRRQAPMECRSVMGHSRTGLEDVKVFNL